MAFDRRPVLRAGADYVFGHSMEAETSDFVQAAGGSDLINAVKQATEFGLTQRGAKLAALVMFITEVHALSDTGKQRHWAEKILGRK